MTNAQRFKQLFFVAALGSIACLSACSSGGGSDDPAPNKPTTGNTVKIPLTAPANFKATLEGANSIKTKWDASLGASSYKLHIAQKSISTINDDFANFSTLDDQQVLGVTGTSHTVANLKYGRTYYLSVQAVGNSALYNDSAYQAGTEQAVLIPVPKVTASAKGNKTNAITISWTPLDNVTDYEIYYSDKEANIKGKKQTDLAKDTSGATAATVTTSATQKPEYVIGGLGTSSEIWAVVFAKVGAQYSAEPSDLLHSMVLRFEKYAITQCVNDHKNNIRWARQKISTKMYADKAADYLANLDTLEGNTGLCGTKGWRLPNKVELESMIVDATNTPHFDQTMFPQVTDDYYFTSDSKNAVGDPNIISGLNPLISNRAALGGNPGIEPPSGIGGIGGIGGGGSIGGGSGVIDPDNITLPTSPYQYGFNLTTNKGLWFLKYTSDVADDQREGKHQAKVFAVAPM